MTPDNPDNSGLILQRPALRPSDIIGPTQVGIEKGRPLVFLNACTSAGADISLTGIGGWAKRFVDAGVTAFIGSLWEVNDTLAAEFAEAFYDQVIIEQSAAGRGVPRGPQDHQRKRPWQPHLAGLRPLRAPERHCHSRFLTLYGAGDGGRTGRRTAERQPVETAAISPSAVRRPPFIIHHSSLIIMTTPMRRQYLAIKKQFPDTILFFRLGDFYETFDDDARIVSEVCDVVLTSRPVGADERVPLAGVPYHSVDPHIAKLVAAGYKVAIAEQIGSEPPPGEKLVERTVRRVITAGTIVEPAMLEEGRNNYLAAIAFSTQRADRYGQSAAGPERSTLSIGLAYADITTGEFAATELEGPEAVRLLQEELARLQPAEVLVAERRVQSAERRVRSELQGTRTEVARWSSGGKGQRGSRWAGESMAG